MTLEQVSRWYRQLMRGLIITIAMAAYKGRA